MAIVDSGGDEDRNRLVLAFVGLGLVFRLGCYLLNYPLWWDRGVRRGESAPPGLPDLVRPLDYGSGLPPALPLGGTGVRPRPRVLGVVASLVSVRLHVASVPLFWVAASRVLRGRPLLVGRDFRGVRPPDPARRGCQAVCVGPPGRAGPPDAGDRLVAGSRRDPRLWLPGGARAVLLVASHPAAFVVAGMGFGDPGTGLVIARKGASIRPCWRMALL